MRFNASRFLIPTVILLGCVLFAVDLTLSYVTFWAPYGLLLLLVYRWGRRQDIYPLATFYTLLVAIDGLRDFLYFAPEDTLSSQVLHVAVTWFIAWLLCQRMKTDEQLARERAGLEEQVHARTAELEREVQVRRQAEAAAQASEERYRLLAESGSETVWAVDMACNVTYVSPSIEHLRGYSRQETLDMTWEKRLQTGFAPDILQVLRDALAALRTGQAIEHGPFIAAQTHKSGSPIWTETVINELLDSEGRPVGLRGMSRDVTAREHMEQELRHLNEDLEERVARRTASLEQALADLQQALHLKSEFMAMISHELRTPLTGVITMAELLEQQIAGPINERQLAYVHTIQKSGARLLCVVNSIISYAHLVSGDVQLQREPCDLTYLICLAAATLRPQAAEKQQTLDLTVDPPDLAIESDAEALVQVVKRLLDNAVKFTPPGGKVGMLAQRGPVPATVQIVVWDTGIGVPGGDLGSIVKPFTQADGSLTRSHEGVGMGLAYADRMVTLLGGRLELEPNSPAGSRFIVTLPGPAA